MKKLLSTFSLAFCILIGTSQIHAKDYTLKLNSGDVTINAVNPTLTLQDLTNTISSKYVIVQFNEIPTNEEKNILQNNGVELLEYLPLHAFIAEINNPSATTVESLNIRGAIAFQTSYKYSKAIANQENPSWAVNGNTIDLTVEPHLNVSKAVFRQFLLSEGHELLTENPTSDYFEIRIRKNDLANLANTPMVKSIDYIPAPPEKEDQRGRSLHRANMLDSDHPLGRQYDGSGVSIAIADDAVIGPHIDIKGRVTSFAVQPNGTHGDMTTGIAMGAGNLNPDYRGMATGAYLYYYDIGGYPHIAQAVNNLNTRGVVITSTSFSEGCNAGYTSTTRTVDQQTRQNPTLLHVFSAGNSSSSTCGGNAYGAGTPWGTITGGRKQGKAVIATGNLTYNAVLTGSSSRGPAADGRIKPDICANGTNQMSTNANNTYQVGGGTSAAAPGIAGLAAQLYQGFRELNSGTTPESGLIKSAMLNTARDLGNVGPDFTYGWGRVNAHRAMKLLEENRYLDANISQGGTNLHPITIPTNIEELKFMVYWTDYEASTVAAQSLVNNIDFKVVTPTGDTILPWILDPTPNSSNLSAPATRGIDNLNNMEQVSIDTVNAGVYTLIVDGKTIPQGPQKYFVVWETRDDSIEVTYPSGGESFTPGTTETIRWDAVGNSGFTIVQYSLNNGITWNSITTTNGLARSRDWVIPNTVSGEVLVRVTKGSRVGTSANTSSIIGVPTNIRTSFICPDSVRLTWNPVTGATEYEISQLGATHMDSIGRSTTNSFTVKNLTLSNDNWFSVKALGNGITGKRANAIVIGKVINNCPFTYDVELDVLQSPNSGFLINCNSSKIPITVSIRNNGDSNLTNIPLRLSYGGVSYFDTLTGPLSSGVVQSFTFSDSITPIAGIPRRLSVINLLSNDQNETNDSLGLDLEVIGTTFTLPYSNDFESFTNCPTTNDCGATICNLNGGWYNATNGVDDDFDMRVDFGGTPSTGTGPSIDHNPGTGTGNYLYSEASNGCYNVSAVTISPCFDLSNTISPEFSFWYHMTGTAVGNLRVDVFSNGVWVNNVTTPLIGSQANAWLQRTIDMSSYVGQTINLRFTVTTGNNWSGDIAIDDISFVDQATSLENVSLSETFRIYPNPSEGIFTIQFNKLPENNIQIMDMNGRVIEELNVKTPQTKVDLSSYAKGVYFLTVRGSATREKLIIY